MFVWEMYKEHSCFGTSLNLNVYTHTHTHTHTFISSAITLSHLTHTKQPWAGQQHTLTHSFITHFHREMLYELKVVLTTQWEKTKDWNNTETWENHLNEMRLWWRPQMRSVWYLIYLSDESLLLLLFLLRKTPVISHVSPLELQMRS